MKITFYNRAKFIRALHVMFDNWNIRGSSTGDLNIKYADMTVKFSDSIYARVQIIYFLPAATFERIGEKFAHCKREVGPRYDLPSRGYSCAVGYADLARLWSDCTTTVNCSACFADTVPTGRAQDKAEYRCLSCPILTHQGDFCPRAHRE